MYVNSNIYIIIIATPNYDDELLLDVQLLLFAYFYTFALTYQTCISLWFGGCFQLWFPTHLYLANNVPVFCKSTHLLKILGRALVDPVICYYYNYVITTVVCTTNLNTNNNKGLLELMKGEVPLSSPRKFYSDFIQAFKIDWLNYWKFWRHFRLPFFTFSFFYPLIANICGLKCGCDRFCANKPNFFWKPLKIWVVKWFGIRLLLGNIVSWIHIACLLSMDTTSK